MAAGAAGPFPRANPRPNLGFEAGRVAKVLPMKTTMLAASILSGLCLVLASSVLGNEKSVVPDVSLRGAFGQTYQVGPSRTFKTIQEVATRLAPGDLVLVDGDASYFGPVALTRNGTPSAPITIRGVRVNGKRPLLTGGRFGINVTGHYQTIEGFEITGTTKAGIGHYANGTIVTDCVIHDNVREGIIGWGSLSGSITVEYSEFHHNGANTTPPAHQIYMATDEVAFPLAVFRLQYCYLHDGNGGNNVKSRSGRSEIYYNWIEGASLHGLELIGFDFPDDNPLATEATLREDGDVVGNVIYCTPGLACVRVGGDKPGASSYGRFRFVNNTFILNGNGDVVRTHEGVGTIEMHNNVVCNLGDANGTKLFNDEDGRWPGGRQVGGRNNWIQTGTTLIPVEFTGTIAGESPGLVDLARKNVQLTPQSPLIDRGDSAPGSAFDFPRPLFPPLYEPPLHSIGIRPARERSRAGPLDTGAYEFSTDPSREP